MVKVLIYCLLAKKRQKSQQENKQIVQNQQRAINGGKYKSTKQTRVNPEKQRRGHTQKQTMAIANETTAWFIAELTILRTEQRTKPT